MEKDIRQSLQEHIFRLENRRRELMRPEYLRLGLTYQSTVASGVPDLSDRGGKGDGSRGLQLLSRNGKKDVQRAD